MFKTTKRVFATILAVGLISTSAYGITNPLKNYDLYADTRLPEESNNKGVERERGMEGYYQNSVAAQRLRRQQAQNAAKTRNQAPAATPVYQSSDGDYEYRPVVRRRNEILRESSKETYANSEPAGWEDAPSFYPNPQLSSIIDKYHRSNFAGCLQESISYVKIHPKDTLGYYYMAMSYAKVNDKENAIKAYEKVISLNDNPMIVKYATNGRNCVVNPGDSACFQDVNVPDYYYPYAEAAQNGDLIPIDPQELINRNLEELRAKAAIPLTTEGQEGLKLPFGEQNDELDAFINAPYGNGLAPDLNNQYKETQLKRILETINGETEDINSVFRNMKNIKNFDNTKN